MLLKPLFLHSQLARIVNQRYKFLVNHSHELKKKLEMLKDSEFSKSVERLSKQLSTVVCISFLF